MIKSFFVWLLTVVLAFSAGAGTAANGETDSELRQKVRDHMDVIVDEAAGIVDDINEEIRNSDEYIAAEEFAEDVNEIVDNTMADIEEHFPAEEEAEEAPAEEAAEGEAPAEEEVEPQE